MGRPVLHVVWELTLRCDLACRHCGSRAGRARGAELDTRECLDLVDQLAALGATEVSLIGGEAYLREDWATVAARVVDAGMRCSMVSGGRGFTPERAEAAAAAGVSSVSISVDGLAAAHDAQRGLAGSFDAAVASLVNLRAAGLDVSANSQINRQSQRDLDGMLDLFLAHGLHAWQVALTVPMGRAAERPDLLLQPYELLDLFPRLAALAERGRRGGLSLFAGNNVGYFGPHERALRSPFNPELHFRGCEAGVRTLGIEADGTLKGCPSLPTAAYSGGSVRERPLAELWRESRELAFMRDEASAREELWGYCASCYYRDACKGGCSWTAHVFFGRRGNNPYCHHRALEHHARGLRERLVSRAPAPGLPFDHGAFDLVVEPAAPPQSSSPRRRLPVVVT